VTDNTKETDGVAVEFSDKQQITEFNDQSGLSVVQKENMTVQAPSFQPTESRDHTIYNFLERPRNVATITWGSASTPGTVIFDMNLPDEILSSDMTVCKTADFRFFSCNSKIRFQINANKFAIGKLMVVAFPVPSLTGSLENGSNLTSLTGYPHCFIDAGSGATVEFEVPYMGRKIQYDMLRDSAAPWARISVYVFNPLNGTSGSTTAEVSIYLSATKICLSVPTPQHITPFTPARKTFKTSSFPFVKPRYANYHACMSEAEEAATKNSISTSIRKVGNMASAVGGLGLGPISTAANVGASIADVAASALQAFGLSKPQNYQLTAPMVQQPAKYYSSFNGTDNSIPLAYDAQNGIDHKLNMFCTSKDEMDIAYVASKPTFIETLTWTTSQVSGTVIASWPVTPGFCGAVSAGEVAPTLLAFITHMFSYWRGSISYKLDFTANQFYSGRIALSFFPGYSTITSPVDLSEVEAAPKVVCDIRQSTDCVFTAPFLLNVPYLETYVASRTSTAASMDYAGLTNLNRSGGLMVLYVINQLAAPATVPSSIYINLFAFGGPDLEFAVPICDKYVPVHAVTPANIGNKPLSKKNKNKKKEGNRTLSVNSFVACMSDPVPENLNLAAGASAGPASCKMLVASTPPTGKLTNFAATSIGEKTLSLRSLCKMFSVSYAGAVPANEGITVDPCWFNFNDESTTVTRIDRISRIYAFWRGGMRYKFMPQMTDTVDFPLWSMTTYYAPEGPATETGNVGPPFDIGDGIGFSSTLNMQETPFMEVMIPFYHRDYLEVVTDLENSSHLAAVFYPLFNDGTSEMTVLKAGADDFTFGYLIGPPNLKRY